MDTPNRDDFLAPLRQTRTPEPPVLSPDLSPIGGSAPDMLQKPAQPQIPKNPLSINQPLMNPQEDFSPATGSSLPPIQGGQTFRQPLGGSVTMPNQINGRTAQDIQSSVEQNRLKNDVATTMFGSEKQYDKERFVADRSAEIGASQIIKSLRDKGMGSDQIKKKIGYTDGMTSKQVFTALNKLNVGSQKADAQTKRQQRVYDKITNTARFNEDGSPKNEAGQAQAYQDAFAGRGEDESSDKTLYDLLPNKKQREIDRYYEKVANKTARGGDTKRIARFMKEAERMASTNAAQKKQTADDEKRQAYIDNIDTDNKRLQAQAEATLANKTATAEQKKQAAIDKESSAQKTREKEAINRLTTSDLKPIDKKIAKAFEVLDDLGEPKISNKKKHKAATEAYQKLLSEREARLNKQTADIEALYAPAEQGQAEQNPQKEIKGYMKNQSGERVKVVYMDGTSEDL